MEGKQHPASTPKVVSRVQGRLEQAVGVGPAQSGIAPGAVLSLYPRDVATAVASEEAIRRKPYDPRRAAGLLLYLH